MLDAIDRRILAALQREGRISNQELAEEVGLSPSPCLRRVRALEEAGVIQGYVALVDHEAIGLPVTVFVSVTLERQEDQVLEAFENAMRVRPEVLDCVLQTGEADYFLRVVVADLAAYERFLAESLSRQRGIGRIRSSFVLRRIKATTALPL